MLTGFRTRVGRWVVYGIIGLITFVFVVFGVFTPKATRGLHEASIAGSVNREPISVREFQQELNQRVEFFKKLSGGTFTEEQLRAFQIHQSVFQDIVRKKLLAQLGPQKGLVVGPEELRERVRQVSAFQKNGAFDFETYKAVLAANGYTPGSFEKLIRDEAYLSAWDSYFKVRSSVSELEIRDAYHRQANKRKLEYVVLNFPKETDLKKSQDLEKQTLDQAQSLLQAVRKSGFASSETRSLLKSLKGVAVQKSEWLTADQLTLTGFGTHPELRSRLFGSRDLGPFLLRGVGGVLVSRISDSESATEAGYAKARSTVANSLAQTSARKIYDEWMKQAMNDAKVERNASVVQ